MNQLKFWEIIQAAHDQSEGKMDLKCEAIKKAIAKLQTEEAQSFAQSFNEMMDSAYHWDLWGAAYIMNGGCGDDSFSDFRASLISRGRKSFETALAQPDSLSDEAFDEDTWFYEGYQYAVTEAVEAVAGTLPPRGRPPPEEPLGESWEEDSNVLDK